MTTKDTIMEAIGLLRDAEQELTEAQSRLSSARRTDSSHRCSADTAEL